MGYGKVVRVITGATGTKKGAEVTLQLSDGSAGDSASSGTSNSSYYTPSAPSGNGGGTDNGQPATQSDPLFSQEDVDRLTNDVRDFFGL